MQVRCENNGVERSIWKLPDEKWPDHPGTSGQQQLETTDLFCNDCWFWNYLTSNRIFQLEGIALSPRSYSYGFQIRCCSGSRWTNTMYTTWWTNLNSVTWTRRVFTSMRTTFVWQPTSGLTSHVLLRNCWVKANGIQRSLCSTNAWM